MREKSNYGIRRTLFGGAAIAAAAVTIASFSGGLKNNQDTTRAQSVGTPSSEVGYKHNIDPGETISRIAERDLQEHHGIVDPSTDQINERVGEISSANPNEVTSSGTVIAGAELYVPSETNVH